MWSINVNLRLLEANIDFLWWGDGVACTVIFMSNPTTVLWLRCVVVGVVTIEEEKFEHAVLRSYILFRDLKSFYGFTSEGVSFELYIIN